MTEKDKAIQELRQRIEGLLEEIEILNRQHAADQAELRELRARLPDTEEVKPC